MANYQVTKINYKSDFTLEMSFTVQGQPVSIPEGDFALVFRTERHGAGYACTRIGNVYTNCKMQGGSLVCVFDNHNLKPGILRCEMHDLVPDALFPTGTKSIVTPSTLAVELVEGAAEGDEVAAEIIVDLDVLIAEAGQAVTDANNAADAADEAARAANGAAERAEAAISELGDTKVVKYGKMVNGEMYPYEVIGGIPVIGSQSYAHDKAFYYVDVTERKAYQWSDGAYAIVTSEGGGTTYTAGNGINITGTVISADVVATPTEDSTKLMNAGGIYTALGGKQDTLVSGTSIKTVNSASVLGSGDIALATPADLANFCPLIEDGRTSSDVAIIGTAPFATLADGQRIVLHFKYRNEANPTLQLTLSGGDTTLAYPLYQNYNSGVGVLTVQAMPAGSYGEFVYDATNSRWMLIGKDVNTTYSNTSQADINNAADGSRLISPKLLRDNFPIFRTVQDDSAVVGTVTLNATKYHDLGTTDTVDVELPSGARTDEFLFTFTCDTAACTLSLPTGVKLGNGLTWEAAAGRRVQVSIMDGIALYAFVDPSNE